LWSKIYLIVFLLVIIIATSFLSYSQDSQKGQTGSNSSEVPKNVLIELFINADCNACPKAAFCLEELAWNYEPGQVILVEAHIWDDGYDIPETNSRYNWYVGDGKKGTPDAFFNGLSERIQGLCCNCGDINENIDGYQQIIEKELAKNSQFQISAEQGFFDGKMIVQGELSNLGHSLLKNLVIGGMVYYEGEESELFYLVKDIFENQDVCQLAPMEEKKFSFVSELDLSGLEESELDRYYGVVFIQDRLTKEVLQSYLVQ
jgi:hypothetical protein